MVVWRGWALVGIVVGVLGASACGPSSQSVASGEGDSSAGGGDSTFDYGTCAGPTADASCDGLACAEEGIARDSTAILLEVIAAQGKDDVISISQVSYYPDSNQLIVDLHLQIGWYRAWEFVETKLPETSDELREIFADQLANLSIPDQVVDPMVIADAMRGCDPSLVYDPCGDNWALDHAHTQVDGSGEGCTLWSTYAEVDVQTGERTACVVHEVYGCE